jgi:predicted transcriptional regulator
MQIAKLKQQAHDLVDRLPETATWDDLMREIYEHQAIERGIADADAGRVKDTKDIRAKYDLPE